MKRIIGIIVAFFIMAGTMFVYGYYSNHTIVEKKVPYKVEISQEWIESFIKERNHKVEPELRRLIAKAVVNKSIQYDFDRLLLVCIIDAESNWNVYDISEANAKGLMQVIPEHHREAMNKLNIDDETLFYIENNLNIGVPFMSYLLGKYEGNVNKALSGYNSGPTATDNRLKAKKSPCRETRNYTINVTGLYSELTMKLNKEADLKNMQELPVDNISTQGSEGTSYVIKR